MFCFKRLEILSIKHSEHNVYICLLLQIDVALAAEELKTVKLEMSQKLMEVSGSFIFIIVSFYPSDINYLAPD